MSVPALTALIARCRLLCRTPSPLTDAALLSRFTHEGDLTAFEELLQRHAILVWGVCRRILCHEADCEDAFQATFLALVRRAGAVEPRPSLGAWLHTVAVRVARKTLARSRRQHPQAVVPERTTPGDVADAVGQRELLRLVDEEIERLPPAVRVPLLLCCLQGRTRDEAAEALGCSLAAIKGRLERGRHLLRRRLARRGVQLPAAFLVLGLTSERIRAGLWAKTLLSVRYTPAPEIAALAEAALPGLMIGKGKLALVLLLLATSMGGMFGSVLISTSPFTPATSPQAQAGAEPKKPETPRVRTDRYGDPLPEGALARLGTVRQRAPDSQLAVTADGKEIVAVGDDLTVRRFDARTGELLSVRQLPKQHAIQLRNWLSPRGTFVLSTGAERRDECYLDLWDLGEAKIRQVGSFSGQSPLRAAFSTDERRVAIADSSNNQQIHRILLWDPATGKSRVLWSEKKTITAFYFDPVVVFSPDGKRLIACHYDQILRCWDVENGKLLWQSDKKMWSSLIVFSPDGRTLIAPSGIGTNGLDIRDAATGKLLEGNKPTPKEAMYPLGFSPDGRFLAFQTGLEEIVLWEPGKEKITFRFPSPPHHRDNIHFIPNRMPANFAFTPDSKGLIRRAGALQRWDLTTGKSVYPDTEKWGHTEDVNRLLFSPNGRLLASSSKDQTVRLWDVSTKRSIHTIPKAVSNHLAFTPDGLSLLTVPYSILGKTVLQATDASTGRPGRSFELADRREFMTGNRTKELRVTADGKKIMMLTWKNGRRNDESVLTAWDAATGECLVHKRVPWGEESLLTPDGQSVLAPDTMMRAIRLLDVETAKPRWQLNAERTLAPLEFMSECGLALSPNGRLMAGRRVFQNRATFRIEHESILLADMVTGRQLAKLSVDGPAIFDFSSDNRLFAVAESARIRLWETATWRVIGFIPIPNRDVRPQDSACASSLAFSPDGRALATGHADGTILLWDATLQGSRSGESLAAAQRESLWTDLAAPDAAKAYAAVWRLTDDPDASVAFLKERLKPILPLPPDMQRSLLEDLDSERFAVREAAEKKLRVLGERVASSLRGELKAKPSLEKRKRIEELLAAMDATVPLSAETLRSLRAVQVLERIGSSEARQLLAELSRGVESARQTQAANEALMRLNRS